MGNLVKLVVFVPKTHADVVRTALADTGAGIIGNYINCTFSISGKSRYLPVAGAHPFNGKVGRYETVEAERIETVCSKNEVKHILEAVKKVHPDEEVDCDIYPLINEDEL